MWPQVLSAALFARLGPAVLFVALGVVVPLLPPLSSTAQAATSFRTALLVAAALSLATGPAQIPESAKTAGGIAG